MLQPDQTKYRKRQKGRLRGMASRGRNLAFGEFGLQATTSGYVTARQIEASRVAISRLLKKGGKMWIRIFPDKPLTKKPAEVRMGKGKGAVELWVAPVQRGRMLFEMEGVDRPTAAEALRVAGHKLPILTQFVSRDTYRAAKG
ncbi:MAG: 50S ribosomal protein L16 [Deltaproteobacteria bacterium]|nr:50S ribosomal protein L16 [Deltaproteobacteria bacterium]